GIKKVLIDSDTVKKHSKLLVGGVWCLADLEYQHSEDRGQSPWILSSIKPIQLSRFDYEQYLEARRQFSTEEWIDLLLQSIGLNPEMFGERSKLLQLVRLIPFCERNYNLIELGPKGTGKSHIYSEFSPHGILISGGEITAPKLFVNNQTGKIGLVGYWNVVAFDEFAGRKKRVDKALVDIMKNYMANKSFSRGIESLGAEASMVFVGNTRHTVQYMLKHTDLFDELPEPYHDSAFLDRMHFYLPGWEVDIIRGEMFSDGYGFVVDYLAEILRSQRGRDFSTDYEKHFMLGSDISTRDKDAIQKTYSGLMKILFPQGEASEKEIKDVLEFAIEGRKRIKDQLLRIDSTYAPVRFEFFDHADNVHRVKALEEELYPNHYSQSLQEEGEVDLPGVSDSPAQQPQDPSAETLGPQEGHQTYRENQRGVTFDGLFGPYLKGATKVEITDPYVRAFHQVRNVMELIETIARNKSVDDLVTVHLVTTADQYREEQQTEYLNRIVNESSAIGIDFTYDYDQTGTIHARHIITDHGWKISLDRGLDIFQRYDMNDALAFSNRMQEFRGCKAFEITYLKV
ncbi:BREX system Lon protease-like protein BrxL, partial [Pseudomonadota bacterium]